MTLIYHTPLSADTQRALGIDAPQPLAMADQVRFGELDALQHVNNAVYMQWFERVRVAYVGLYGLTRTLGRGPGPRIVIRSATIHYRQEMVMDEDYVATCACRAYRTTSFTLHQQIWSGGTLRADMDCVLVLLQPDGSARYPIPAAVSEKFVRLDGAAPDG